MGQVHFIWDLQLQDTYTSIYYVRPMAYGHLLTKYFILHYIFYFMYTDNPTKTNEISFNTLLLVIAYYVYRQYVTL